jgi:hypothetical protein
MARLKIRVVGLIESSAHGRWLEGSDIMRISVNCAISRYVSISFMF